MPSVEDVAGAQDEGGQRGFPGGQCLPRLLEEDAAPPMDSLDFLLEAASKR